MGTLSVEKQIEDYLSCLTATQKKAVLTVVKTIALAHQGYNDIWKDEAFAKQVEERTAEYETGKAKLHKFEHMKKAAIETYKAKKRSLKK